MHGQKDKFATTGRYAYLAPRAYAIPIHAAYYGPPNLMVAAPFQHQQHTDFGRAQPSMHQYASLSALTGYAASPPYHVGYASTSAQQQHHGNHDQMPQKDPNTATLHRRPQQPQMRRFRSLPRHYYSDQRLEARNIPLFADAGAAVDTQESSMDNKSSLETQNQPPPSVYPPVAHYSDHYRADEHNSQLGPQNQDYAEYGMSSANNYSLYGTAYRKNVNANTNTIYGSGYCANSYIGYHQQQQQQQLDGALDTQSNLQTTQGSRIGLGGPAHSYQTLTKEGSVISDYPKELSYYNNNNNNGMPLPSQFPLTVAGSIPATTDFPPSLPPPSSDTEPSVVKNKKCRFLLVLGVLVIIIGILIAMAAAVYSQVRTHSSVIRLVRQHRGYLLVTDGASLEFDPRLLDDHSNLFARKAALFEKKIDQLFEYSELRAVYEGCDVTAFRFVIAIPAMEVHFSIKTKVNVNIDVRDILTVLHDGINNNVGDAFNDSKVDLGSLTVENERLTDSRT